MLIVPLGRGAREERLAFPQLSSWGPLINTHVSLSSFLFLLSQVL